MNRPREHSKKQKIKAAIVIWLAQFRPGDIIQSEDLVKAVKRHLQVKYIYSDSVIRYARELRQAGVINYNCLCKFKRTFEITEIGDFHSL